jgi:hypothetical protein
LILIGHWRAYFLPGTDVVQIDYATFGGAPQELRHADPERCHAGLRPYVAEHNLVFPFAADRPSVRDTYPALMAENKGRHFTTSFVLWA